MVAMADLAGIWVDAGIHAPLPLVYSLDPAFGDICEGIRIRLGVVFQNGHRAAGARLLPG